jgi:hypothetical protein
LWGGGSTWPATAIGGGDITYGFWLGNTGAFKLIAAPKSTEVTRKWGSVGIVRNTTSTTNGVANTDTLYAFGSTITSGHPAAHYCKLLSTGGYNTWYLPAQNELNTLYSNKSATPFATANSFIVSGGAGYWSSTESTQFTAINQNFTTGAQNDGYGNKTFGSSAGGGSDGNVRATRRSTI